MCSKMCAYKRSCDADHARITRVIKVSGWLPSVQCSISTVVLELCILSRYVNERWTKEQRSQPKRSCNLDQQSAVQGS